MDRSTVTLSLLAAVLLIAVIGLTSNFLSSNFVTGLQSESTTSSQAVVGMYVAISLSGNLTDGIAFGNITVLPSYNVNATYNYNSTTNQSRYGNETFYFLTISQMSNINADFCIRSTQFNTSGGVQIDLGNYTWNDSTTNDYDYPNFTGRIAMLTNESYKKGVQDLAPGNNVYYRFWLNVTDYTEPGTYNSTVWFEGVPTGDPC